MATATVAPPSTVTKTSVEGKYPYPLTSFSTQSFLLHAQLNEITKKLFNALVDCGASTNFIDFELVNISPALLTSLDTPIPLQLFDGHHSDSSITHCINTPISFADGMMHHTQFLIM
jgi:hypothetical protein